MPLDWDVQLLRLSIFSRDLISATETDWKIWTGEDEAENRLSIPGGKAYVGAFSGGQLGLSYAGPRLDVVWSAVVPEGNELRSLPTVGKYREAFEAFSSSAEKFLSATPTKILRVAFACSLMSQVESREEGYKQLATLLTSVALKPEMTDFLYRCNWHRTSNVIPGMDINRLTTWSVVHAANNFLQIAGEQAALLSSEGVRAIRLEIDHNTDAATKEPFEQSKIVPIFKELRDLAAENAAKGELQ
jgi:hypothetical protein